VTFSEKVGNGPMNKWLNFGGDPDYRSGYGYMDPDPNPNRDTGKTCTVPWSVSSYSIEFAFLFSSQACKVSKVLYRFQPNSAQ